MLTPTLNKHYIFSELADLEDLLNLCDSVIAVINNENQLAEWLAEFEALSDDEEAPEFCYGMSTLVFDIDGDKFVMVSDSGGEFSHGEFAIFCEENGIESQFVVDTPVCDGITVDEIYTGQMDDNRALLELLHKVYN